MGRYVILGNGVAGTRAAEMLRDLDQDAEIVVVTEEVHPFYRRPLLVDYVTGRGGVSLLAGRKKDFYEAKRIELLLDRRAESVDPAAKVVTLSDGKELGYDKLLVATGRKPVGPEDTQDDRIIYMKTLADADRIRGLGGGDGVLWCTGTECWLWRWFGHSPVWVSKPHILFPASVSGRTFWTLTRRTLLPLVSDLRERRLCTVRRFLRCRGKVGPLALL